MLKLIRNLKINTERLELPPWWTSHFMAPAPLILNNIIRIFVGGHDSQGISRVGFIDINIDNPEKVIGISRHPVLDIGSPGCFDENGVFPGSIINYEGQKYLTYTGFQLGFKIPHFNFGNLASFDENYTKGSRLQNSPILDRSEEGLAVRAGITINKFNSNYIMLYAAGSSFEEIFGKLRPNYSIFRQDISDLNSIKDTGKKEISYDCRVEHGLGRPYLIEFKNSLWCLYTIRNKDFNYKSGIAQYSSDINSFVRMDNLLNKLGYGEKDFDDQMVYFPGPCVVGNELWIFYSGNNFGKTGLGIGIFK